MPNRLSQETSPYLRQHRDNPVDWYPWGDDAFDEAKRADKPVLLSVGYAACHWCHVMAHESFEDPATASMMNRNFINIKLDREERPDLDQIYQNALALLGQSGGWPLTMFLTPDREPFWGGTYFPPEPRWGRPSFQQVLTTIATLYRDDHDRVTQNRDGIRQALHDLNRAQPGALPDPDFFHRLAQSLPPLFDPIHGGTLGAPKFPQAPLLSLCWALAGQQKNQDLRDHMILTLKHMSLGGIYDHLGGGYARYSVDEYWLVPHFEKMLYDNAQLIDLLCHAFISTGETLFKDRVIETVTWLRREMMVDDGFAAALDADSEGEEGQYYVWSQAEIDSILTPDAAALFARAYDVSTGGNWEGKNILNQLHHPMLTKDERHKLSSIRQKLLMHRGGRIPPQRDDKVLTDWNGMTIAALAQASVMLDQPEFLLQAKETYGWIRTNMVKNGVLHHSFCDGKLGTLGLLDDHAQLARAALFLYGATGDEAYLHDAISDMETVTRQFTDREQGGLFQAPETLRDAPLRAKTITDGPVPSGQSVAAENFVRLYLLTGEDHYRSQAETIIRANAGAFSHLAPHVAGLLHASLLLSQAPAIFVCCDDPDRDDLAKAARRNGLSHAVIGYVAPGKDLPRTHPAFGKNAKAGQAFICRNMTCSLPITDPDALARAIALN